MNELINETEEIKQKKLLLKNAEQILKQEFVGIDNVIEGTLLNMRPWFLYPELQDKPLVISLFGMTGSGKTSLVRRILQLLDIETDMVYFNFAEIGEMKSWEIEDTLDEQISSEKTNRVFVYDEFQYAATLDSHGEEKDNKSGLKPFWELLDTGIIHKRTSRFDIQVVKRMIDYMTRIDRRHPIELKNGVWQNAIDCLNGVSLYDMGRFQTYFELNLPQDIKDEMNGHRNGEGEFPCIDDYNESSAKPTKCNVVDDGPFFIRDSYMNRIHELYERIKPGIDRIDLHNEMTKMNFPELCSFLQGIIKESEKGYDMNFNDSIVFVLANIDEAYQISFNVNPDMLPDQFHKITEKLTIVDIKEALRHRFRNEQIARLGNLFMIYPSFSEESFRKIIDLQLNKYRNDVLEKWGLNIEFDQTIKDFIYTDSVFPTHGTRPIISAVHEIVKTKLPLIVDNLNENDIHCAEKIVYSYEDNSVVIKTYCGGEEVNSFPTKTISRLNSHRGLKGKNEQTLIATHESGHFIMYVKLFGRLPEKVCSSTVSKDAAGFMLEDSDESDKLHTKEDLLNVIKVCLGGYVAEGLVFGENKRSSGASQDLKSATITASDIVRKFGMTDYAFVSTYLVTSEATSAGSYVREDSQIHYNELIKNIIKDCLDDVKHTLMDEDWKKMFKGSAKYLSENVNMPKEKMAELYDLVPDEKKVVYNENYYSEKLESF